MQRVRQELIITYLIFIMKKVHSILALVMVGAIALFSCNSGPSEEEKAKHLEDSMRAVDSITKANAAATPAVNQDSINAANAKKAKEDSIKLADSLKKAGNGKKTTPAKPVKPAKPANSTNVKPTPTPTPAPTPAPAPTPKPTGGFDKKGDDAAKGGSTGGFEKKGDAAAKDGTTGGFKKK